MSTHCYIGIRDNNPSGLVCARYVHSDGGPAAVIAALRAICTSTACGDARRLVGAVLAHDWDYLDPAVTTATTSWVVGARPVPGVGMTLAAIAAGSGAVEAEPVSVFPLSRAGDLDAGWLYLIDVNAATVAIHTADGDLVGAHPLAVADTASPARHVPDPPRLAGRSL